LSARCPLSMIKTRVTRAAGPGYWNEWPIGPEPQAVASLPFLLFLQSGQFHHILREKNPSRRWATGRIKTIRCVTLVLKTPTRDGETEIRILTNLLRKEATTLKVADLRTHAQVKWHNRRNHNQGTHVPRSPGTRRAARRRSPDTVCAIDCYDPKLTDGCLFANAGLWKACFRR